MSSKYEKFVLEMKLENTQYCLWKKASNEVLCVLESYKEKRAVFFSASNLIPSVDLLKHQGKQYHLLLMGQEDGGMIYQDFGTVHVDQMGRTAVFEKFTGPSVFCYSHCLFVAESMDGNNPEIIYKGETPFSVSILEKMQDGVLIAPFSQNVDETCANWKRIADLKTIPEALNPCRPFIERYGHYILGETNEEKYVGVPGRFLQNEQPCKEEGLFLLWQPLKGGEEFFEQIEDMTDEEQEKIFGYWIAKWSSDGKTLKSV